jgi:hypothetical protein
MRCDANFETLFVAAVVLPRIPSCAHCFAAREFQLLRLHIYDLPLIRSHLHFYCLLKNNAFIL